ncbi:hybrid sensor histidine kinase/response regulator transcription factor [Plebeiibacterium marinum]|uniref:histidine kinase n=1 Tax=Plebeiibacterium marinum TaxID=2992111 RepID=A0AAE3MI57_9BACT|nr:hybrid sensor histidine kinase/response regulator transcription factor [Plebeiobacterium marinum]MCW3807959.1 response regulator [Plebeiobacterium marinum]
MRLTIFILLFITAQTITNANILHPKFIHYTNKEGLSSSYVKGIKQDKYGFIWIATRENITRFEGNRFVKFPAFDVLNNEIEIEPQSLSCINDSLILVESMQNYYYYFDYENECFKPYMPLFNSLKKECISGISANTALFIQDSSIRSLNIKEENVSFSNIFSRRSNTVLSEKFIRLTSNKNIVAAYTSSNKVLIYNHNTQTISQIQTDNFPPDNVVFMHADIHNNIWLGIFSYGLIRINYPSGKKEIFTTKTPKKLPHDMVHCVAIDRKNRAWIGTENGLCIWDEYNDEFECFKYNRSNPEGLNTNPIYNALADKDGNIWLGTYFGGINLWCNKPSKFTHWKTGTGKTNLGGKVVSSFVEDNNNNIWIGTEDMGVNMLAPNTGTINKVTESLPKSNLSYENVHDILLVNDKYLWIATYSGGINILNTKNNNITCIKVAQEPELGSDFVYSLTQKGNYIYIGTDAGISIYNKTTKKFKLINSSLLQNQAFVSFAWKNDTLWFCSYNTVYSLNTTDQVLIKHDKLSMNHIFGQIFIDSKRRIWIATNDKGLLHYDETTKDITYYNKATGFTTNRIFAIEEADDHTIWVSTNLGLVNLNPETNTSIHYDSNSGIPFNQFNFRAAFKDSKGILYFGGNEGMISVNPKVIENKKSSDIQLTELLLFNKHISPGANQPISSTITNATEVKLKHNQNVLTINYASLDYSNKGQISYAYQLEGFDKDFNYAGNKNSATYTNLDPGHYTFVVKASNDAWVNESAPKKIKIHIKPPFWQTPLAFLLYSIIFLSAILILNKIIINMQQSKALIALERQKRLHNEEINNFKLEFFTNISHEIKTPLSLILGPLSDIIENYSLDLKVKERLNRIHINVHRLNNLLGELLEFRKIDKTSVNFRVSKCSDLQFIKNIEDAFRCIAEHREIGFKANYQKKIDDTWLNKAIIEKIIFNLLSNSFKYCNPSDTVVLSINTITSDQTSTFVIVVKDDGPGISANELDKIQTRFYQSSKAKKINNGTGIGLSYVNNLVKMHHGEINIESELDKGTTIKITLPGSKSAYSDIEIADNFSSKSNLSDVIILDEEETQTIDNIEEFAKTPQQNESILVVEDNLELQSFLRDILSDYNIQTASNGKEALNLIKNENQQFDFIVSDIMMPEMDGLEFTSVIKSNLETSHIPVMLLTAKSGTDNQYEGLKHGADVYLEKPFLPQILKQNIINILKTRKVSVNRFSENIEVSPSELTTSARDKEFIEELTSIIEDNIDNSSMDVQFLIDKIHVSRSLLHIKLKSLLNCSTTEYIRIIRLRKAIELISKEKCSFSEAAYKTGFTSLTYFSRAFKNQYGKSPRDYFTN